MSISLKHLNSFGIDAYCDSLFYIKTESDLIAFLKNSKGDFKILGGGSNVLLTQNLSLPVLKNEIKGISVEKEGDNHVLITVGSGEIWHDFVMWAVNNNYCGLENLALIPGTVGAAPIQNIGAYGVEQNKCFESLEAVSIDTGETKIFNLDDCNFGYRNSIFKKEVKGKYFITRVKYRLSLTAELVTSYKDIQNKVKEKNTPLKSAKGLANIIVEIREKKLPNPNIIGNGGSFFKNPVIDISLYHSILKRHPEIPSYPTSFDDKIKIPAAWLIDKCGFRGIVNGNTGTHERQALVIVNRGNATGKEILNFSKTIQAKVHSTFGIHLEPEINFW